MKGGVARTMMVLRRGRGAVEWRWWLFVKGVSIMGFETMGISDGASVVAGRWSVEELGGYRSRLWDFGHLDV